MSPEFIELITNYDAYKDSNNALVEKLEACIQQNRNTIASGKVSEVD